MKVTDLITLGTKMDIRLMVQMKKQEEGGERALVYKSSVCDFLSDTELEILMPTQGGRMVLFQLGAECNLIFYTKSGMYTTTATVTRRYRKDRIYLISVDVTGALVKFQRREFYRVPYIVDMGYQCITMDIARCASIQEVEHAIAQEGDSFAVQQGRTLDVSGGGMRFSTGTAIEENTCLFLRFRLKNGLYDTTFSMVGEVISSQKHPREPGLYINRIRFLFKDLRDREKIVRFVFEEERRMRNKGADKEK
jgi:c-di-GMP-binding flagellar brake protein YcgR